MKELMTTYDPIDILFGGMEKLGPGGNVHTSNVLRLLPQQRFHVIVDAGCVPFINIFSDLIECLPPAPG